MTSKLDTTLLKTPISLIGACGKSDAILTVASFNCATWHESDNCCKATLLTFSFPIILPITFRSTDFPEFGTP